MKVVINTCYGGFSVSKKVYEKLGMEWDKYGYLKNGDFSIVSDNYNAYRCDPRLIEAIESIGTEKSSGDLAKLDIIEIPDELGELGWYIENYDGMESIHETHKSWA